MREVPLYAPKERRAGGTRNLEVHLAGVLLKLVDFRVNFCPLLLPPLVRLHLRRAPISSQVKSRFLGGVPREQKMLEGHLPRVIYHQVYQFTKIHKSLPTVPSQFACRDCCLPPVSTRGTALKATRYRA